MQLHDYPRSSAAYRVRIALNLKRLDYQSVPVNLLEGKQKDPEYLSVNPQGLVPSFTTEDGRLSQSLAIIEWLEETYPEPALLPTDPWQKAQHRSLAYAVACDIHPLNNMRIPKYLKNTLEISEEAKQTWYAHWITTGFAGIEKQLVDGPYASGTTPGMIDCTLVPQVYNARRFEVDLSDFPKIIATVDACNELEAFQAAAPEAV